MELPASEPRLALPALVSRTAPMLVMPLRPAMIVVLAGGCLALFATADEPAAPPTGKLPPAAERTVDFATDIQPLLRKNCHSCHGAEHQEGGLRLDQKKRALEGGDNGAAIISC